jgi:nucleotidyltransferase/DNA polymerase involved in DNA repair
MTTCPAEKIRALRQLQEIPGVGPSISEDLWQLGIRSIRDLRGRDPETLYSDHCAQKGAPVDRCVLYVFRCAVYFAAAVKPDPELLKWWNWKDHRLTSSSGK